MKTMDKVEELTKDICRLLNSQSCTVSEAAAALSGALYSLGLSIYDKGDLPLEALKEDYKSSPTFGAALMLQSTVVLELLELFIKERASNIKKEVS